VSVWLIGVHTSDGLALVGVYFENLGGSLFLNDNGPELTLVEFDLIDGDLVGDLVGDLSIIGWRGDKELGFLGGSDGDFDLLVGCGGGNLDLLLRSGGGELELLDRCGGGDFDLCGGGELDLCPFGGVKGGEHNLLGESDGVKLELRLLGGNVVVELVLLFWSGNFGGSFW
jgi:hypothetical protein